MRAVSVTLSTPDCGVTGRSNAAFPPIVRVREVFGITVGTEDTSSNGTSYWFAGVNDIWTCTVPPEVLAGALSSNCGGLICTW